MSREDQFNIHDEKFRLPLAYWYQTYFLPEGICYFDQIDDLYTVSPYPENGSPPEGCIDLLGMADLAIRWSYDSLYDIFNEKRLDKSFDQLHYRDPFTSRLKDRRDQSITKKSKKELEQFLGVRDNTPKANNLIFLLKYMLWTDNKPHWEQFIAILSYMVCVKSSDPLFEEFVADYKFVLEYVVNLPRTNTKNTLKRFEEGTELESLKGSNQRIYKDLYEKLRTANSYYKDVNKTEQIISCLLPFLMNCSYQIDTVTCCGKIGYEPNDEEEITFDLETVTVFSHFDNRASKNK